MVCELSGYFSTLHAKEVKEHNKGIDEMSVPPQGKSIHVSANDQSKEQHMTIDEQTLKVRKPYTISKQRERWKEEEHKKFIEALQRYGRAWRRIEEHIGTKTVVQIRSHAQKFFSKVAKESEDAKQIEIPPPRPKRKPMHPYPRKTGNSMLFENDCISPTTPSALSSSFHETSTDETNISPTNKEARPNCIKLFGTTVELNKSNKSSSSSLRAENDKNMNGKIDDCACTGNYLNLYGGVLPVYWLNSYGDLTYQYLRGKLDRPVMGTPYGNFVTEREENCDQSRADSADEGGDSVELCL